MTKHTEPRPGGLLRLLKPARTWPVPTTAKVTLSVPSADA